MPRGKKRAAQTPRKRVSIRDAAARIPRPKFTVTDLGSGWCEIGLTVRLHGKAWTASDIDRALAKMKTEHGVGLQVNWLRVRLA